MMHDTSRESPARRRGVVVTLLAVTAPLLGGYLALGALLPSDGTDPEPAGLAVELSPAAEGIPMRLTLPISFGDIGPRLIEAGTIDPVRFATAASRSNRPLTDGQRAFLLEGSDAPIVLTAGDSDFWLQMLWAFGLTNRNALLEEGPMMRYGPAAVGRFASTGGWPFAGRTVEVLYASLPLIALTTEQQARLEEAADAVYRPCCNNPTSFPDCNHGMAMLGLLELMAAQDATVDEMLEAAKYVNGFWFPQQSHQAALMFRHRDGRDFIQVDARRIVGAEAFSAAGAQAVGTWLVRNGHADIGISSGPAC